MHRSIIVLTLEYEGAPGPNGITCCKTTQRTKTNSPRTMSAGVGLALAIMSPIAPPTRTPHF